MNITQSSLVIVGANTPEAKVFWDGQPVEFVKLTVNTETGKYVAAEGVLSRSKAIALSLVAEADRVYA